MVGDNVLDSEIGSLDVGEDGKLRTQKEKPFISVYVGAAKVKDGLEIRALNKNGSVDIVFEAGIASPHVMTDPETDESVIYGGLPATDANFEFQLDMTIRQIGDALNDPQNEWAELFRSLTLSLSGFERDRVGMDANGTRLAAHRLKLTMEVVADPVRGVGLVEASPLARFFAKCEADLIPRSPDMAKNIALMRAQISGDADDLRAAMRRYGMAYGEADAMLMTPACEVLP
ncbi:MULTISPECIES: hypothetical protein [unclassified Rhizobium]|uniref:hypothetical protein n=1 Tax=unclassified Rhizobium TaxID=2613769 RepID=UPI0037F841A1